MRYSARTRPHILVVGLGNLLLQDDGVGIHAVRALLHHVPRGVCVAEVGTAVLDALHLFEWADHILAIDAMLAGGEAGWIYRYGTRDVYEETIQSSLHELSLVAALRFLTTPHTPEITILGVEPSVIDYGLDLSPVVQNALPRLCQASQEIIAEWLAHEASAVLTH